MKSAKEMFELNGYEQTIDNTNTKYIYMSSYHNTIIEFDEIIRTIRISQIDKEYAQTFNIQELQAINKQVEELHWNDITVNIDVKLDGKKVMEAMRGENNA